MSQLALRAYRELMPQAKEREVTLSYSGHFRHYNANVRMRGDHIHFSLSREWEGVSDEIVIGLLQHLLRKLLKSKRETPEQRMYERFLKHLTRHAPRGESDPELAAHFTTLNEEYFAGLLEQPNLRWGRASVRTLGHYHYASDTVTISTILREDEQLLRYVLYHELLHKKHKFSSAGTRTHHHTKAFREDERRFKLVDAEQRLERFVRGRRCEAHTPRSLLRRLLG